MSTPSSLTAALFHSRNSPRLMRHPAAAEPTPILPARSRIADSPEREKLRESRCQALNSGAGTRSVPDSEQVLIILDSAVFERAHSDHSLLRKAIPTAGAGSAGSWRRTSDPFTIIRTAQTLGLRIRPRSPGGQKAAPDHFQPNQLATYETPAEFRFAWEAFSVTPRVAATTETDSRKNFRTTSPGPVRV
jgi:hypothetical protein